MGRAVRGARRLRVSESSMQKQAHPPMMQIGPATQPSLQGHSRGTAWCTRHLEGERARAAASRWSAGCHDPCSQTMQFGFAAHRSPGSSKAGMQRSTAQHDTPTASPPPPLPCRRRLTRPRLVAGPARPRRPRRRTRAVGEQGGDRGGVERVKREWGGRWRAARGVRGSRRAGPVWQGTPAVRALAPLVQPTSAVSAGSIHLHNNNKQLFPNSKGRVPSPLSRPCAAAAVSP